MVVDRIKKVLYAWTWTSIVWHCLPLIPQFGNRNCLNPQASSVRSWGFRTLTVNTVTFRNFIGKYGNLTKFYRRHSALVEKYSVSLKTLLQQGISEHEFYGDLVYRFRMVVGKSNFSEQFRKLINRYKRIGYSLDIMRQTACLVVNPIIVDGCASFFNCTTAVRASDAMTASS